MLFYVGIDLHSSNSYLGVVDSDRRRVCRKKAKNNILEIHGALSHLGGEVAGVAVESTYNWYWLVDGLRDLGYKVSLANPSAIQKYRGLKHMDDGHDAFWLAELLSLNILPTGYIYPKEIRPVRDLLRKRSLLVKLRMSLLLNLQNALSRQFGVQLRGEKLKAEIGRCEWLNWFSGDAALAMSARTSKEAIDFLTARIKYAEKAVHKLSQDIPAYRNLYSLPGVGRVLALTISLETGPIERFKNVGNYASYCRKVKSEWVSNEKAKGSGNTRNGNRYLAWAFSEAAEHARRHHPMCRSFFNRKLAQTHFLSAHNALGHKLARAAFYIMRDQVKFDEKRLFAA